MESAFAGRLDTNYVPSDEEVDRIRMDLVSHVQELARMDERIRELSAQRDRIQAYIDSHTALLSYPRRLPVDIVREIFVACLPTDRNAVMSAQEAPLILCQICSAWRTIALTTPRLWASLHVPFEFVLSTEQRMQAVVRWLQLSGACPISLSFSDCVNDGGWGASSGPVLANATALIKALAAFSARWRHVEFMQFSSTCAHQFAGISPPLESFKLTGNGLVLRQLDIFNAQSLRTVIFNSQSSEGLDDFISVPLAWNQLTHLTLHSEYHGRLSFGNTITLLRRCARLISFRVATKEPVNGIDFVPVLMPFLQTLIMSESFLTPRSLSHLIEYVTMPQLRQFHVLTAPLHVPGATSEAPDLFLVPLATRSPLIQNLAIYLTSFTPQSLPETLRYFPSLTKLEVFCNPSAWQILNQQNDTPSNITGPAQLLELLTPGLETTVCPILQELIIKLGDWIILEETTVETFIRRRMDFKHGLRRLEIVSQYSCVLDLVSDADIRSYLSRGLDISLVLEGSLSEWGDPVKVSPWTGLS
ncbi:hypothetical protein B0H19DRAFT_1180071 [Mycena capillaripes]|nr:hypothetical protein B0H19DRAFT_1180071 [Mycena capillaripes]